MGITRVGVRPREDGTVREPCGLSWVSRDLFGDSDSTTVGETVQWSSEEGGRSSLDAALAPRTAVVNRGSRDTVRMSDVGRPSRAGRAGKEN